MLAPKLDSLPARLPEKKRVNTKQEVPHKVLVSQTTRLLNLSFKFILNFPPEIFGVEALRELNLGHNNIEYIPDEIANLKNLKVGLNPNLTRRNCT